MKQLAKYDVIIMGGGLAGLTLALQLKRTNLGLSVLVLEKRENEAPVATHKVGESTSELGAFYLREVLGLDGYLTEHQLRKLGFRFFFSRHHNNDIAERPEVGSKIINPYPTHQLDRGILENDLLKKIKGDNVDILMGAKVLNVELSKEEHKVSYERNGVEHNVTGNWLVDSSGRSSILKRKLALQKESGHHINAAWFRLECAIDVDDWSDDMAWKNYLEPGKRRLATNHLMGEGYWVWIIALISGSTSIGIVADPRYHSFGAFNTFEKSMEWLKRNEPLAARMLGMHKEKLMDFKVMKDFAYDSKQFYSAERWALTGEAGAFLDALYSPGSDFIALGNTWITDLIVRDKKGEDILLPSMVFDLAHKELLNGWFKLYTGMYGIFGTTQIMLLKIVWDWASYWAIPNVLFINNGLTNIAVLKQYSSVKNSMGQRFAALNEKMQELFRNWKAYDAEPQYRHHKNVFDLQCLRRFQLELRNRYQPDELVEKIASNLAILELIAAEIFRMASAQVNETPGDMKVNPYTMAIEDGKDLLLEKSTDQNALEVEPSIKSDIARMWISPVKINNKEHA